MITGKDLIELGFTPNKTFKQSIEYANTHDLHGEELKDAEIKIKLLYVSLLLNVILCIILSTK
jgi:hypothetical protein